MSETKFSLPGAEIITISGAAADKLVRRGNGDAALLYIYILRRRGDCDVERAAAELGRSREEIRAAMKALTSMGLLLSEETSQPGELVSEELPQYTASDFKMKKESDPDFCSLVSEVQKLLGKTLSSDSLNKLLGIYDSLSMPSGVVLMLVNYCVSDAERKNGPGSVPSMLDVQKEAKKWKERGVLSIDRAERYILELQNRRSAIAVASRRMGITERMLSPSEQKYLESWLSLGFTPDAIAVAYDRTVTKTGKLAWKYMDSIINSWHSKGIHTPEEIEARDSSSRRPSADRSVVRRDTPTQNDYERTRRYLDKMKEENDVT